MSLCTYPSSAISPLVADGAAGLPPAQTSSGRFSVDLAAFEIAWLQPLVSLLGHSFSTVWLQCGFVECFSMCRVGDTISSGPKESAILNDLQASS